MTSDLSTVPTIAYRAEQPYLAVKGPVTMNTIPAIADRFPEVFGFLAAKGIEPAGAPFLKYNVIDMEQQLEMEAGVPVPAGMTGDGEVFAGVLPAGRYATVHHVGHPEALLRVTAGLLEWAAGQGLEWDMSETSGADRWACRMEEYHTDPAVEPDMNKWETDLAFKLADRP